DVAGRDRSRGRGPRAPAGVSRADPLPAECRRPRRGRDPMTRALAVVAVLAGVAHADPDKGVDERARVDVAPAGAAFKQLVIDNPLGDVRVEGYDGTAIRIETRKHAPDEDTLDRLRVSLVPNPDGTVRITTTADASRESKPV